MAVSTIKAYSPYIYNGTESSDNVTVPANGTATVSKTLSSAHTPLGIIGWVIEGVSGANSGKVIPNYIRLRGNNTLEANLYNANTSQSVVKVHFYVLWKLN